MKVITLSNFSVRFLSRFIEKKLNVDIVDSEYDQYMQQICLQDSVLYQSSHDVALLFLDFQKLLQKMVVDDVLQMLSELVVNYVQYNTGGVLLIANAYIKRGVSVADSYGICDENKQAQNIINEHLNALAASESCVMIFDLLAVYQDHGYLSLTDHQIYLLSDSPFSKLGLEVVSSELSNYLNGLFSPSKKCLVLDFDNTLWAGIAGEDGINVKVGDDRLGEVYRQFQWQIKKLKDKGILLAACSKNNIEDAKLIFDNHPNMVLCWDDFIIHKVNWQRKDLNIVEIARELNIGDDSLVFIDDSASERLLVSEGTNAVVPDFPKDLDLLKLIFTIDRAYFSTHKVTEEDISKHQQYVQNIQRGELSKKFTDINDFINSLRMHLYIRLNNLDDLDRAYQLVQKTNQFNFTNKRYTRNELVELFQSESVDVLSCRVEDRFGDYGMTALLIVRKDSQHYIIDNFVMSCRVLGKKVEDVIMHWYLTNVYEGSMCFAQYIPSAKNKQLENKYSDLGFELVEQTSEGRYYKLSDIQRHTLSIEVHYE
ncbi:HAD-IIIC family phosphatase [Vibrio vulnificus]|nr:HAD-IIIC family phosphatase [Vibrio vulnificus]